MNFILFEIFKLYLFTFTINKLQIQYTILFSWHKDILNNNYDITEINTIMNSKYIILMT